MIFEVVELRGSNLAIGEIKKPRVSSLEEFDDPDCTNFPFNVIFLWFVEKLTVSTIGFNKTGSGIGWGVGAGEGLDVGGEFGFLDA